MWIIGRVGLIQVLDPMFDSLAGGFAPICVIAAILGLALARVSPRWLALLFASAASIAACIAWYWVPQLIWPPAGHDYQSGWAYVAVFIWSLPAILTAIISLVLIRSWREKPRHEV